MSKPQKIRLITESILSTHRILAQPNAALCSRCLSSLGPYNRISREVKIPRWTLSSAKLVPHGTRRGYASSGDGQATAVVIPAGLADQHALVKQLFEDITQDPRQTKRIPDEKRIMRVLATYERLVEKLTADPSATESNPGGNSPDSSANATSAMLKSMNKSRAGFNITASDVLDAISSRATRIIEAPSIFVTASVLKSYITLQSLLNRPQNFPSIFEMYRNKPTPRPSNQEPYMSLAPPTPNAASVAVDPAVASTALSAAIKLHSLPLCLDIIDSTFCTPAYFKGKILRNAIVPLAGAALAPAAAYALASKFALLQNSMDPAHATTVAMAGIVTYVATVGTMGYIAVTTSNDQMVRVTWATGTPLWERWVREEERGAVDRVAQAWGFRNKVRWGDEEGPEWDTLREWAGLKGMVLDRVELMHGMQ